MSDAIYKPTIEIKYDDEADIYVAHDTHFGIWSQGETKEEAEYAIRDAIYLYLTTMHEKGLLKKVRGTK